MIWQMERDSLKKLLKERIEQLPDERLMELFILAGGRLDERIMALAARPRQLGSLEGKASCRFHDDFKITDEEFLRS